MKCIYCKEDLTYKHYYGIGEPYGSGFEIIGGIYRCENEECEGDHFYTDNCNNLHEGSPI